MTTHQDSIRCFDIGGTKIVAADIRASGDTQIIARVPTPLNQYTEFLEALARLCPQDKNAIGISLAGVVHPTTGVATCANIPSISGRAIQANLCSDLDRPVVLVNDANAFALAQTHFGSARNHDVVLAIILGTGVGGSLVVNKQLLCGVDGTAGEWGHAAACAARTGIALPRVICNCGQMGCIDTFGGARGLERLHTHLHKLQLDSHGVLSAWENNENTAMATVDLWLDIVGGALAGIVNLIGPSVIVAGGGLASNAALMSALDREINKRRLTPSNQALIVPARGDIEDGLLGAALTVRASES